MRRSKIHVIPTGVDAEDEFSPDRVRPVDGLADGAVHVLYPGRLVEQKDPLLFCDVAARAVALEPSLRFEVVGEGPLEPEVRRLVAERGLDEHVRFHPPTNRLGGWFAGCDLLLMTSRFEGVPYVAYEAMAMGVPVVAPALAGNVELLGDDGGALIEPRDDADAYARALAGLATDAARRRAIGERSRARTLGELSVTTMARRHEALYETLLSSRPAAGVPAPALEPSPPMPAPARLAPRSRRGRPLRLDRRALLQRRPLPRRLHRVAMRAQTWPEIEIHVVDDASTDPGTLALLSELERSDDVSVLRMPENGGPSAARNAALERVRGRYVLPVDADNMLLPDAVERLAGQLADAREDVGFIYPEPAVLRQSPRLLRGSRVQPLFAPRGQLLRHLLAVRRPAVRRRAPVRSDITARPRGLGPGAPARRDAASAASPPASRPCCTARAPSRGRTPSSTAASCSATSFARTHPRALRRRHGVGALGQSSPARRWRSRPRSSPGLSLIALREIETDSEAGRELQPARPAADLRGLRAAQRAPIATGRPRRVRRSCDVSPRRWRRRPPPRSPTPAASPARRICSSPPAPARTCSRTAASSRSSCAPCSSGLAAGDRAVRRGRRQVAIRCGGSIRHEAPDAEPHTILLRRDPRADAAPRRLRRGFPGSRRIARAHGWRASPCEWRHSRRADATRRPGRARR